MRMCIRIGHVLKMVSHKKGESSSKSTRNELTLKQRVELIEYQKKNLQQ